MSAPEDADELALPQRIAGRDLWRLLARARPHRLVLGVCLVLALLATLGDLVVPWATKVVIDDAVAPPWRSADVPPGMRARLAAAGALPLADGTLLVDSAALSREDAQELEHGHHWRERRFVEVAPGVSAGVAPLELGGRRFIDAARLPELSANERLQLRGRQLALLADLAVGLSVVLALRFAVNVALARLLRSTGQRIVAELRAEVIGHLLRLPAAFFDIQPVGRLVTRATNDVAAVEELFTAVLITVVRDCLLIVGGVGLLLILEWRLALVVLACTPMVVLTSWTFRRRARDINRELRRRLSEVNAFLAESLSGWRTVQACAQEPAMAERFAAINHGEFLAGLRQMRLNGLFLPLIALTGTLCAALVILVGGHAVGWGWLSLGGLVAFTSYIEMAFAPIRDLAEKYNLTQSALAAGERIFALLEEPPEAVTGSLRPARLGALTVDNVSFRYPPRPGGGETAWVLEGVSMTVGVGERIALVGATGSGKTTLASLLVRVHDPSSGALRADGVDLRALDRSWLRSRIATVSQDVHLYAGTLAENLTLFGAASDERLRQAAALVHADAVIARLPGGLAHRLGERGGTLSSGERQLVALARAVVHDPELLILDEATAHIDSRTEALVQDGLARLLAGRSALIIAHRLSTIRSCDRIIVLHHGRIAEQGSHAELLALGGRYADLHRQFVAEEVLDAAPAPDDRPAAGIGAGPPAAPA
jgi:ABC-type multidrug transport system fused ATPase/permease subunit